VSAADSKIFQAHAATIINVQSQTTE